MKKRCINCKYFNKRNIPYAGLCFNPNKEREVVSVNSKCDYYDEKINKITKRESQ